MTCDGSCNYRRLYEGSQASLSDLAGKQAAALKRTATLRESVLTLMKQYFPAEFAAAEQKLGQQIHRLDDELMLAYVQSFLAASAAKSAKPAAAPVAHSADDSGSKEIEALRQYAADAGITIPEGSDPPTWMKLLGPLAISQADTTPARDEEVFSSDYLQELFDDAYHNYEEPNLDQLFDEGEEGPGQWFDETESTSTAEHPLEDLFSDEQAATERTAVPQDQETQPEERDSTDAQSAATSDVASETTEREEVRSDQEAGQTPPPATSEAEERADAPDVTSAAPQASQLGLAANMNPVRPEIVPTPARPASRRGRKKPRVSAAPPQGDDAANGSETHLDVSEVAKACVTGPVFEADLLARGIPAAQVSAWEEQVTAPGTHGPFRIVKGRDRDRGFLVIPTEPTPGSVWEACVTSKHLRGQYLYEVAIIVKNNPSVAAVDIRPALCVFTTSEGAALVFVGQGDMAEGSPLYADICEVLPGLMSGATDSVVLLSSAVKQESIAKLANRVTVLVAQKDWDVACVVTAGFSRKYSGPASSTVTHVLP